MLITADEFAALMRPLGPWPAGRRVAVAVSGGPDSLALALLLKAWCAPARPTALVVDHGLRPASAAEADRTLRTLAALGLPARLLTLAVPPGTRLQERARHARYQALVAACADAALLDLLLAHHAGDQSETVRMRAARGSGPDGLAGMSALSERATVRLLRPLLHLPKDRLRATLDAAAILFIDDPSNRDLRFERARLRLSPPETPTEAPPPTPPPDRADWLARHILLHEAGFALLPPGPWPAPPLARLLQTLSGREHPPRRDAVERLAAAPRPATLHGVRLLRAGRAGPGFLACREPASLAPPIEARPGALWDRRFRLAGRPVPPAWTLGPLGPPPPDLLERLPPHAIPKPVLPTLPALRDARGDLRAIPHLAYGPDVHEIDVIFAPDQPLAPSFFIDGPHSRLP